MCKRKRVIKPLFYEKTQYEHVKIKIKNWPLATEAEYGDWPVFIFFFLFWPVYNSCNMCKRSRMSGTNIDILSFMSGVENKFWIKDYNICRVIQGDSKVTSIHHKSSCNKMKPILYCSIPRAQLARKVLHHDWHHELEPHFRNSIGFFLEVSCFQNLTSPTLMFRLSPSISISLCISYQFYFTFIWRTQVFKPNNWLDAGALFLGFLSSRSNNTEPDFDNKANKQLTCPIMD